MRRLQREELSSVYIDPELKKEVVAAAAEAGVLLRAFVERALRREVDATWDNRARERLHLPTSFYPQQ